MLCIWWDQKGFVYYELLKSDDSITGDRLQLIRLSRALREKWPEYEQRYDIIIFLHDNARPNVAKVVKKYLETLKWDVLPHVFSGHCSFWLLIVPKDATSHQFTFFAEIENWLHNWIVSKEESFFRDGIRKLPERWKKIVGSDGQYFNWQYFNLFIRFVLK